jgi:general stress protein 26
VILHVFSGFTLKEPYMKIENQSSDELEQLGKLIEDMKIAMLTRIDIHGALTSRPMTPLEMDGSGALWFFIDQRNTDSGEQGHAVNLGFTDHASSTYVSVSGHAEVEHDRARIKRLWTPFAKPWFPDGPDSTDLALLKVTPDSAEYWDGPHSKIVRSFAMAASIAAAKPIGLGEHDTLSQLSKSASHLQSR